MKGALLQSNGSFPRIRHVRCFDGHHLFRAKDSSAPLRGVNGTRCRSALLAARLMSGGQQRGLQHRRPLEIRGLLQQLLDSSKPHRAFVLRSDGARRSKSHCRRANDSASKVRCDFGLRSRALVVHVLLTPLQTLATVVFERLTSVAISRIDIVVVRRRAKMPASSASEIVLPLVSMRRGIWI